MKIRNSLLIGLFLSLSVLAFSQDTLKIMQYNLLYYGKDIYDCNQSNNNIDDKNVALQTILEYAQPDIFCVNEMDASLSDVNYLMDNVLNINEVTHWQHANVDGSYSINMIYYNSDVFSLNSQASINASPRKTNVYKLTHLASSTNFTIFVAHLKAGSDSNDEDDKAQATQNVMNYIASQGSGNYLFMGDLNLYSSSSQAFQNLINPSNSDIAFYDPANRIGNWSNNYSFSDVHTQSTHSSSDCFVGGGMDDRFDFIMMSEDIKDGNDDIKYLANSYETIGQDGNHYNDALTDGANNSAPSNVINALYNMSDHLPVSMKMIFGEPAVPVTIFNKTFDDQNLNSGGWTQYSVLDENRVWSVPSTTYGHNNTHCTKITGYDYDNNVTINNEDWLISPSFSADEYYAEVLTFWTAGKYSGNDLQVYYSNNYTEGTNPNTASWSEITGFHLSTTSDYTWESSENIDLSQITGENTRIAFKYTSTESSGARVWEIDDILLIGTNSNASISKEISKQTSFSIFPNPAKDFIIIENSYEQVTPCQIYNIQGELIQTEFIAKAKAKININSLPKGIYFVRIGKEVKKLILE